MMTQRKTAWIILVAALAALGASVGWAVSAATSSTGRAVGPGYGRGYSMMGLGRHATPWYVAGSSKPVQTIAAARSQAQTFAARLDLRTGEVMRFANNFYVLLKDKQGKPATEVLVDPRSGLVTLEYGPAMMWNTRYGMMSAGGSTRGYGPGMMRGFGAYSSPSRKRGAISPARADAIAQSWLDENLSGRKTLDSTGFPGYYTIDVGAADQSSGMLSVNASTGAVWYHSWHGRFLAESP